MKKRILKYPVSILNRTRITTDGSFQIVRVAYQRDELYAWAEVMYNSRPQTFELIVYGTGQEIPVSLYHVGSAESPDKNYIWHVYADYNVN
jgi:hypothetical protein